jgi:hypothetical protein
LECGAVTKSAIEQSEDYEVGYGKPPKEHQFKKGRSGNPRGRPKADRIILLSYAKRST